MKHRVVTAIRSNTTKSGFTLTELLVVIAIIGILAAMLFPALQGALLSAKASKAGNAVKGFQNLVFSESLDADAMGYEQLYAPAEDDEDAPEFATAEEYIVYAVTNGITAIDFTTFSLPGAFAKPLAGVATNETTQTTFLDGGKCGWCVVQGLSTESNPNVPFMFTANIKVNDDDGLLENEDDPLNDEDILNEKMAIVVYAQGAVKIFKKAKFIKNDTFNPSGEEFTYLKPKNLK